MVLHLQIDFIPENNLEIIWHAAVQMLAALRGLQEWPCNLSSWRIETLMTSGSESECCEIYMDVIVLLLISSIIALSTFPSIASSPFKKLGWFVDARSLAHILSVNLTVFWVSVTRCKTKQLHVNKYFNKSMNPPIKHICHARLTKD